MGAEAEVGDHDWTVISGQSNRSFDFRFDLEQVDDAIEVFLVDVDEVSVDGFWSPVESNGYGTERNGSASGFGMVRNERNG